MTDTKQRFNAVAQTWDQNDMRLSLAKNITDAILESVSFSKDDCVLDFGCGTGLVGLNIAPFVGKLVGADLSSAMLEQFQRKADESGLSHVETLALDADANFGTWQFDRIVSAMAFHHIEEPSRLIRKFSRILSNKGLLAIADLDKEDGSFHSDNTGVYHFGFSREEWVRFFTENGFEKPSFVQAHTVSKNGKTYEVILCFAAKA